MSAPKLGPKSPYAPPVLHVLPVDETFGKTIAKGGEGFYRTTGSVVRTVLGNSGGGVPIPLTPGVAGGADGRVNYDES